MISVIIPTLNEEKLLPQLLAQFDAQIRQEYEIEVIISDGGSTDDTISIAASAGFQVVNHEGDHRQTIAEGRNLGAAVAKGELLVFVNADVRFSDIRRFFGLMRPTFSDERVAGATCAVHVFPEDERPVDVAFHTVHNAYVRFLNLIGEGMGRGECQVVSRSLFVELGGYNPSMAAGEDYDLFRRVRRKGRIAFLHGVAIFESPRRFRKYGYGSIVWGWTRNALAVIFKNRSSSEEWEAVR